MTATVVDPSGMYIILLLTCGLGFDEPIFQI